MYKSDLAYILGLTMIGSSIAYISLAFDGNIKPINAEEYDRASLVCTPSSDMKTFTVKKDGIEVLCYDGEYVWLPR